MLFRSTPNRSVLHLEAIAASGVIAENRFYYLPDKHIDWPATTLYLDLRSEEPSCWQLTLVAPTVVRDLAVIPPAPAILSDNYIDLLPGRPHMLRIQFAGDAPSTRIPLSLRSIPCGLR